MQHAVAPTARQRVAAAASDTGSTAVREHNPDRAAEVAAAIVQLPLPANGGAPGPRYHPYQRPLTARARGSAGAGPSDDDSAQLQQQLRARIQEAQARQAQWQKQYQAAMQKEAEEEKKFQEEMTQEDPASMGSTASASTQEMGVMERKFVDTLINGTKNRTTGDVKFHGIMRKENALGQPNHPYTHQRNVVRNIASKHTTSYLVAHDPGLGKTATALMAYCAEACMLDRVPKICISVPSATLDQWQDAVTDWVRINPKRVLVTSKLANVTADVLRTKDIVILSKDCIGRAYATCFKHYPKHHQIQTGPGLRWVSQWDRIGYDIGPQAMPPLHPLFDPPTDNSEGWYGHWDMICVDEVHAMRNPESRLCESHAELSSNATKRVGLTGTPLINKTGDFGGIAKALNSPRAPIDFQSKHVWCVDRNYKKVNRETVRAFTRKELFHRASDKILNLPPIIKEAVNYNVRMPADHVASYNGILGDARSLKMRIERAGRASRGDLERLMSLLQLMQQYIISPLLAQHGVAKFKSEQDLFIQASRNDNATGAFYALRDEIASLREAGHRKVVVAANHTAPMRIVRMWLERNHPEFGRLFVYDGEQSQRQRLDAKRGFLQPDQDALLFLSVGAGGVGLHLVPGCEAIVFWGSLAFSPAHLQQCAKRIHRIGQVCPITRARGHAHVAVRYLVPHGSVDGAIGKVHSDKQRLMDLCVDGDNSGFGSEEDDNWRKTQRIVDEAKEMVIVDGFGCFPPMPETQPTPDGEGVQEFTLLPGIKTRGVPRLPEVPHEAQPPRKRQRTGAEEASAAAAASIALDDLDDLD